MYIDCFDSVKTQVSIHGDEGAKNNAIFSEAFLFNLLLSGYIPNFTPSQFIDSSSIFNITRTNKDIFIDIINSGFITINLFHDELSLRNHFVKCLSNGVYNDGPFYEFSIFPFLNNYEHNQRKKMQENMIKNINDHYTNFHVDGLSNEEAEYMEIVFDNFQVIDILSKKVTKKTKTFTQNMNTILVKFCEEEETDLEFISLFNDLKKDNGSKTIKSYSRSIFYDFLKRYKDNYSSEVIEKMRNYIDNSYNITIASAVDDIEGSKITSKNSNMIKSSTIDSLNPNDKARFSIQDKKNSKSLITWEDVYEILKEVKSIEKEKKLTRKEALKVYTKKQTISNVFKISKYLIGNTLKTLVPGSEFMNAAINIFSDVTINATSECIENKFNMQSIPELISELKKSKITKQYTKKAISTIDYYSCMFKDL